MLEGRQAKSLREIAEKGEVKQQLREPNGQLKLLAPDIVAAILDDQLPEGISLFDSGGGCAGWLQEQRRRHTGSPARSNGTSG